MHLLKKILSATTGYWIHKISTLPIGADLHVDIRKRLKYGPLHTVFDVGANIGQTWEWFRSIEPGAKIYCFEPVSETFEELRKKTLKDKNCMLENIAFGNDPGEKTIRIFSDNSALNSLKEDVMNTDSNASEEIIKVDTLDNYCLNHNIDKIDLLKIDTEGYELNVLDGATKMLSSANISLIFCEIGFLRANNRNTYFADLTEWLAMRDYHFFGLYQLVSNGWKIEFGNALFAHKSILTS
jgi:FkbM family methyltransferase